MRYSLLAAVIITPVVTDAHPITPIAPKVGVTVNADTLASPQPPYHPFKPSTLVTRREHSEDDGKTELTRISEEHGWELAEPKEEIIIHPYRPYAEYTGVGMKKNRVLYPDPTRARDREHFERFHRNPKLKKGDKNDASMVFRPEQLRDSLFHQPKLTEIATNNPGMVLQPNEELESSTLVRRGDLEFTDENEELEDMDEDEDLEVTGEFPMDLPLLPHYYPESPDVEETKSIPITPGDRHIRRPSRLTKPPYPNPELRELNGTSRSNITAVNNSTNLTTSIAVTYTKSLLKSTDFDVEASNMMENIATRKGDLNPTAKDADTGIDDDDDDDDYDYECEYLGDCPPPKLVQAIEKELQGQAPIPTTPPRLVQLAEKGRQEQAAAPVTMPGLVQSFQAERERQAVKDARKQTAKDKAAKDKADREQAAIDQIAREEAAKEEAAKLKAAEDKAFKEKMERKKARDQYSRRKEAWEKSILERMVREKKYREAHPEAVGHNLPKIDPESPIPVGLEPTPDIMEHAPKLFDHVKEPFTKMEPFEEDREWTEELFNELTKPRHPLSWVQDGVDTLSPVIKESEADEEDERDKSPKPGELGAAGFDQGDGWKTDFWQNGLWDQPRTPNPNHPYWSDGVRYY